MLPCFLLCVRFKKTPSRKSSVTPSCKYKTNMIQYSKYDLCPLRSRAAHRDHFVRQLSVCLSGSHTFLVVTYSYVSQATHAFLGMLPLCSVLITCNWHYITHASATCLHSCWIIGLSTTGCVIRKISPDGFLMDGQWSTDAKRDCSQGWSAVIIKIA